MYNFGQSKLYLDRVRGGGGGGRGRFETTRRRFGIRSRRLQFAESAFRSPAQYKGSAASAATAQMHDRNQEAVADDIHDGSLIGMVLLCVHSMAFKNSQSMVRVAQTAASVLADEPSVAISALSNIIIMHICTVLAP